MPDLVPVLRGSGFQSFPLAIDSSGDVYTVTGTSPSDQLLEITTSGQVLTLNSFVGGIIGTAGKLDFGFGGNLFATSNGGVMSSRPRLGQAACFIQMDLRVATQEWFSIQPGRFSGFPM